MRGRAKGGTLSRATLEFVALGRALQGRVPHAHVQAKVVSIDQYAEAALGNREYFLNKPYSIGGREKGGPLAAFFVLRM
jgi:hypothetical protein